MFSPLYSRFSVTNTWGKPNVYFLSPLCFYLGTKYFRDPKDLHFKQLVEKKILFNISFYVLEIETFGKGV